MEKQLKTCPNGHRFYKSSDCPTCPKCASAASKLDFFVKLSMPARRALESMNVDSVERLAQYTEREILSLHGMGKGSLPALHAVLEEHNLSFKQSNSKIKRS